MLTLIRKSALAGLLIGLASVMYMLIENKIVGAFLFSIGLAAVIVLEANLFTGKVGYIDDKKKLIDALIILAVNLVVAYLVGLAFRLFIGIESPTASRFDGFVWYQVLFKGIGTGALIYLAVELYKKTKSYIPVILGVMGFILSGFYHCIADACYFGATIFTFEGLLYLLLVIVGNSIGSLVVRFLQVGLLKKCEEVKEND